MEYSYNNQGIKMWIKEYRKCDDIDVEFEDGYIYYGARMGNFRKGTIKSRYYPEVYGIGYVGYEKTKEDDGKSCLSYISWSNMMKRCYKDNYKEKRPTYKDCSVCEEWHNYSKFKEWYEENYYQIEEDSMCLDKDILYKGNKIYSPETCIFVNNRINCLILDNKSKNSPYPTGVTKIGDRYKARLRKGNKNRIRVELGIFDTPDEAFNIYKIEKEKYIKEVADLYKDKIPQKLYDALYKWEV